MRNLILATILIFAGNTAAADTIAIIGTGNVAHALGIEFAAQGHTIVYGSRNPDRDTVKDLVVQTGHSSAEESLLLLAAARREGVERLLVTHAMADPVSMTIEQMKQAAALGAKMECVWASNLQGPGSHLPSMRVWKQVTTADYARAIKAVGAEHFVLSSDLGQYLNPLHTDGMKAFLIGLRAEGISRRELDLMARQTPAWLLGLED